jgi:hypothetical protein
MKKKQVILIIVLAVMAIAAAAFCFRGVIATNFAGKVFIKAGKPMQFGAYTVLIDKVEGNKLYGIKVSSSNKRFKAESGDYTYLPEKNAVKINLINGAADDYDPENPHEFHTLTFKQSSITLQLNHSAANGDLVSL